MRAQLLTMIRYILHSCLICASHLFVCIRAEPLIGENVWPANPENFNFIASIGIKHPTRTLERKHFCGGSLITKQHVLTAAHCLESVVKRQVDVIVGEVDLTVPSVRYEVQGWITYNQWAEMQRRRIEYPINDIAIVTLETMVDRPGIRPVVLTELNNERIHRISAVIAGWGVTNTGRISDVLLRARVTILTREQCRRKVKLITNKITSTGKNYLCSWAEPFALTACGDSGGPVLNQNNVLLGIVRSTCPNETNQWGDFPTEFINQYKVNLHPSVDYYREFIESQTGLRTRPRCGQF